MQFSFVDSRKAEEYHMLRASSPASLAPAQHSNHRGDSYVEYR